MDKKNLRGPEKAAIFLMSLGEEAAAEVLSNMDEREIQNIGNYMSALGDVDMGDLESVNKEFHERVGGGEMGALGIEGIDFLETSLKKFLEIEKVNEIMSHLSTPGEEMGSGLETVRMMEPKVIASFLVNEHPQTAAIILAHLDPKIASKTVVELPEEIRMGILHRLATLERVTPGVLRELDEALQAEFRSSGAVSGNKLGGVATVAEVMGSLDRATENSILSAMDEVSKDLADEIRNLRFVFEDILKIDNTGIQLMMKEINQEDLLVGLKTGSDELKEKLYSNMSERASLMLKEDLESLGPTKLKDVEIAQQKVIAVCKKLEEEGKISLGGSDEDDMV
jgi:flagellar motor switch protein FliG